MALIELTTEIKAPVNMCFDLARSIDLHKISVKETKEEAIAGVTSGLIGMGEEVTWRGTHFGIRQTLTSKITAFEYPNYFRDEMLKGAFKKIEHEHLFEEKDGVTIMKDVFEFESPGGVLGRIVNKLFLERYMKKLLKQRNQIIKQIAEGDQWKSILKSTS